MAAKDLLLALRTAALFRKGKEAAAVVNFLREGVGSTQGLRPNRSATTSAEAANREDD